jgi:predicted enzyme related to lactoylglutathione lyase
MARVVHFEIHAEKPERAIQFYQKSFGWEFQKWDGPMEYWMIVTGPKDQPGIDGGLIKRQGTIDGEAVIAYVCSIDVPDVDATVSTVQENGGTITVPKMAIPGVGWIVYFKDTEGNIVGAYQGDPTAK